MPSAIGPYILGFALVAGGLLFVALSLRESRTDEVAQRMHDFVSIQAVQAQDLAVVGSPAFRRAELAGSILTRVIGPWFTRLGRTFGRLTPAAVMSDLRHQLTMAGSPRGIGPREFYGIRLFSILAGFGLAFMLLYGGLRQPAASAARSSASGASTTAGLRIPTLPVSRERIIGSFLALLVCSRLPQTWLRGKVRARQDKIRKALPDGLDMLSVCAEAGLGFDQALQRLSENWNSALALEFGRVVAEMQMGVQRQTALRNLADRTGVVELSSFIAVIIQSDELGMSIANTLHAQAEQMRIERRHRAQEEARKMPLKMLFPMMLFMLPAMFAIILGPTVPVLQNFFATVRPR